MEKVMLKKIAITALSVLITFPALSAQKACVKANGEIYIRAGKCKMFDAPLSKDILSAIARDAVKEIPSSVDLSQCHPATGSHTTNNGTAVAFAACGAGETLLNYGWTTDPISLTFIRSANLTYIGGNPIAVTITLQPEMNAGQASFERSYTLNVTATCCPTS